MLEIGLTGGIGSGKSTAAAGFVKHGAALIDADQIVRDLQQPGEKVFEEMLSKWGSDILSSDGQLDRHLVANIVFFKPRRIDGLKRNCSPCGSRRNDKQASSSFRYRQHGDFRNSATS